MWDCIERQTAENEIMSGRFAGLREGCSENKLGLGLCLGIGPTKISKWLLWGEKLQSKDIRVYSLDN